jgi:TonB family protein
MKRCGACDEEFQNQYKFCPVDGEVLTHGLDADAFSYSPTIISDDSLGQRLAVQVLFLIELLRLVWSQFKTDPIAFLKSQTNQAIAFFRSGSTRPYLKRALATSLTLLLLVIVGVVLLDRHAAKRAQTGDSDDFGQVALIDSQMLPADEAKSGSGVGANDQGRVGFNKGKGEGSGPTPARAQGGGGGGTQSPLPPSVGRLPQVSEIPAPIPTTYARALPQSLPAAGINLDPVLWKDLPYPNYGDPKAKSTTPSNGPGVDGGVGTGKGTGVGPGENNGYGKGRKGNMGDGDNNGPGCCGGGGANGNNSNDDIERVFRQPDVTTRARVISKPEPQYTEEARKTGITGTVVLSVVFSRTGQVTNIRAVQTLCCGLTEKAIAAARSIRFIPAMRNGQVVSTYMQLEYNFNLY